MSRDKMSIFVLFFLFIGVTSSFYAQENLDLARKLPVDPQVISGEFDNGLRYMIRVNEKPQDRAEVRLTINAGSIVEDEDQLGFAHLGEHMAFNGTKNFPKQDLINYLESIGMKFGPEVNAYTSFDQVVYMLQLPTDSLEQFEKGFQVLEDWAHQVSYDEEEINKERGVVIEEWRLGRGASQRMLDKWLPVLLKNSQYAVRLPIGKIELLENDDNEAVRRFYKEWYRPDLMSVIAVGDFDPDYVKGLIEKHFASIPKPENPRERIFYPVPDHEETLFAIVTDPEAPRTDIRVYFKRDIEIDETLGDYRESLAEQLYNQMLNNRLDELRQQADPPFMYGYSASGRIIRTKETYFLGAGVEEDGIKRGLDALLTEGFRVKKYGFVESELARAKTATLRQYEQAYNERDKTESRRYADEYVNHVLESEPIPGIVSEYEYVQALLPTIKLAEVNGLVDEFLTDGNNVVIVQAPEKAGLEIPSKDELATLFTAAENKELEPYDDKVSDEPLVAEPPKPGTIVNERKIESLDVTEWTLSNGTRIMLKATDFKNDEIQFQGGRWGGHSNAPTEDYLSVRAASAIINSSGCGNFDQVTLDKKLTGKIARVSSNVSETMETLSGSCSPKDVEAFFQLVYLAFTAPRMDETAFESYKARTKGYLENQNAMPEYVFSDSVTSIIHQYHPRRLPWKVDDLEKIDLETAYNFYKNRFADAGDFYFILVGNIDMEAIKPLVLTYLGGLPSLNRENSNKDTKVALLPGKHEKVIYKGMEEKARVQIVLHGDYEWSRENNYAFQSMAQVLRIKLRETIREEKSGTYGIGLSASSWFTPEEHYRITIGWGCEPSRVDELTEAVYAVIDSVKNFGPDDLVLTKVHESQLRTFETDLEENGWWNDRLGNAYWADYDHELIIKVPEQIETLSKEMIQDATNKYFTYENVARFVLLPEEKSSN
ncbi:insulinase family protein [candidate division KSB1 bacterium]|nr:insulinase family protein [candidate division KSB1 bacterium]